MTSARMQYFAWAAMTAAAVWSRLATASPAMRILEESEFVHDGVTTYCWGVNANASSSAVTDDLIFLRGSAVQCPLALQLTLGSSQVFTNQSVQATWVVSTADSESAVIKLENTSALVDRRTRDRATIIHSNIHTCHFNSHCDPFHQGESDTNATSNQIGNLSDAGASFTSSAVRFLTPGKHIVLAHIIVPATSFDTRYDFAVFTTVNVLAGSEEAGESTVQSSGSGPPVNGDAPETETTSQHISRSQIIVMTVVGAFLLALLLLVITISIQKRKESVCARRKDDSSHGSTMSKGSNYCVRGSNLRTRSSDWTELYAVDDMLPSITSGDEASAIAIMRASRGSTPNSSPSSPCFSDRKVADFRHDVARWDERSSASPITPSSSAILLASYLNPDALANTPANDCFVPLELLVPASPPSECIRPPSPLARWKKPFRKHKKQQRRTALASPDDSGDEQEADI